MVRVSTKYKKSHPTSILPVKRLLSSSQFPRTPHHEPHNIALINRIVR